MSPKKVLLSFAVAASLWAANKGPVSDDTLNDKVKLKLAADTDVKGSALGIDVKEGVVTLSGKGETEKQKAKAEKLTRRISGVKSVENRIWVVHK